MLIVRTFVILGDFKIENFFQLKKAITKSNFNFNKIKNLFFFKSGRWDIEIKSGLLIKLPKENIQQSLELSKKILDKNDKKIKKEKEKEKEKKKNKSILKKIKSLFN